MHFVLVLEDYREIEDKHDQYNKLQQLCHMLRHGCEKNSYETDSFETDSLELRAMRIMNTGLLWEKKLLDYDYMIYNDI